MKPPRVAFIGECMLELQGQVLGDMRQSYGGDTFNTAAYMARCAGDALSVHYATAMGEDTLSTRLLTAWQAEGVHTDLVRRIAGRLPGMYLIETDSTGERSFHYWRDSSAAKLLFDGSEPTELEARSSEWDALCFSGITLAILSNAGRERLMHLLAQARARNALVAFDNNYRPRLWPDKAVAQAAFEQAFAVSRVALVSVDDHEALFGAQADAQLVASPELVLKNASAPTRVRVDGSWVDVPTLFVPNVVDTTAAGDSFAAGYLTKRLLGRTPVQAAAFGNCLAARVIQHPGALIPRSAMGDLMGG